MSALPPFGGTAHLEQGWSALPPCEATSLVRNPLPGCLVDIVEGRLSWIRHPPEDEWLIKKLNETSSEWIEEWGERWRPPWAQHLPAKNWEYYHPNPIELLRNQALNNWTPPGPGDTILNAEQLKLKRKRTNDEFAAASEQFKRRNSRLRSASELAQHRHKVSEELGAARLKAQAKEERLRHLSAAEAPPRQETLDEVLRENKKIVFTADYLDELLKAGLQECEQEAIEFTQLYPVAEGEDNGRGSSSRGSCKGEGSSGGGIE